MSCFVQICKVAQGLKFMCYTNLVNLRILELWDGEMFGRVIPSQSNHFLKKKIPIFN